MQHSGVSSGNTVRIKGPLLFYAVFNYLLTLYTLFTQINFIDENSDLEKKIFFDKKLDQRRISTSKAGLGPARCFAQLDGCYWRLRYFSNMSKRIKATLHDGF